LQVEVAQGDGIPHRLPFSDVRLVKNCNMRDMIDDVIAENEKGLLINT
jgi:hypothetical protein